MEENRDKNLVNEDNVNQPNLEEAIKEKLRLLIDKQLAQKTSRFTLVLNGKVLTELYNNRIYLASVRTDSMNKTRVVYGIQTADHNFESRDIIYKKIISTLIKTDSYIKDLYKIINIVKDCRVDIDDNTNTIHIMSAEYLFIKENLIQKVINPTYNRPFRINPKALQEIQTIPNLHVLFKNGELIPHTGKECIKIIKESFSELSKETCLQYLLANLEYYSEKFEDSKRIPLRLEYRDTTDILEISPEERENAIDLFMEESVRDFKGLSKIYMKQLDSRRGNRGGRGVNISYKATFFNMSVIGKDKIPSFLPIVMTEMNLFNPFLENPTYASMLANAMGDKIFTVMSSHVKVYATDFYFISQKEINSLFNHRRYCYFTKDMLQDALYYLVELNSSVYRYPRAAEIGLPVEITSLQYKNLSETTKDLYSEIPYREVVAEKYSQDLGLDKNELYQILEGRA